MSKKNEDIVIVSKEEAFWNKVIENGEIQIEEAEDSLKFKKAILEMAREKLELAKKKD